MNDPVNIDLKTWKRKNHFKFYKNFSDPYFNICCDLDVSQVVKLSKENKTSTFFTLLYLSSKACNHIDAFKLRLTTQAELGVEQYQLVHPAATMLKDDDTFTFCYFDFDDEMDRFIEKALLAKEQALIAEPLANIKNRADHIFYSVIPWLNFTSFKHANSGGGLGQPKIVFGKIHQENNKYLMPVSVELHHALCDGIDVAKYIECFQQEINTL
ncbi:MAG: chloramphenicol acetyltransferase [Gammaproteobacteria bacterium]|nr:MAG: chloramphenicol acetyltransferase [Gammaproteobacteria bacterium]